MRTWIIYIVCIANLAFFGGLWYQAVDRGDTPAAVILMITTFLALNVALVIALLTQKR